MMLFGFNLYKISMADFRRKSKAKCSKPRGTFFMDLKSTPMRRKEWSFKSSKTNLFPKEPALPVIRTFSGSSFFIFISCFSMRAPDQNRHYEMDGILKDDIISNMFP